MYSPSIAMYPSKCVCIHASVPQWVNPYNAEYVCINIMVIVKLLYTSSENRYLHDCSEYKTELL